jgi:hypothetical protein
VLLTTSVSRLSRSALFRTRPGRSINLPDAISLPPIRSLSHMRILAPHHNIVKMVKTEGEE